MIKNIFQLNMLDILPVSIKTDEITAVCAALDRQLQEINLHLYDNIIIPRIDELDENIIDLLAWQFHVDFYEPLNLDLNKKRKLVKDAVINHKQKGTKSAVKTLCKTVFFDDFEIQEWFEYGGTPYYFRIVMGKDSVKTREEYKLLMQAINTAKNTRSHLEKLISEYEVNNPLYFGISAKTIRIIKSLEVV